VLTLWVAPPKMFYIWYRIRWSRNQLWNCTHFRHPTDEHLRQLDIYRSRTSDRGLSSSNSSISLASLGSLGSHLLHLAGFRLCFLSTLLTWSASLSSPRSHGSGLLVWLIYLVLLVHVAYRVLILALSRLYHLVFLQWITLFAPLPGLCTLLAWFNRSTWFS